MRIFNALSVIGYCCYKEMGLIGTVDSQKKHTGSTARNDALSHRLEERFYKTIVRDMERAVSTT